jgi:opacity protein-like surface antigen
MRKLVLALALASTSFAAPALARDGTFYAGLEGGVMLVEDSGFDYTDGVVGTINNAYTLDHKPGWDIDAIAGYDFGMIRVEGELGYKRASVDEVEVASGIAPPAGFGSHFNADGHSTAWSVMLNALLDFGDENGWSGYVGPGIGAAHVTEDFDIPAIDKFFDGSRGRIAWQVVAGVRTAITPNI